jgi:hypothetical protein
VESNVLIARKIAFRDRRPASLGQQFAPWFGRTVACRKLKMELLELLGSVVTVQAKQPFAPGEPVPALMLPEVFLAEASAVRALENRRGGQCHKIRRVQSLGKKSGKAHLGVEFALGERACKRDPRSGCSPESN